MSYIKGRTIIRFFPKATSTTFTRGDMCTLSSGTLVTATAGSTASAFVGLAIKGVASTDGDYATAAALLGVEIPADRHCLILADVANGTLLTTSLGTHFAISTAGALDFATSGSTQPMVCIQFVSGSQGVFELALNRSLES